MVQERYLTSSLVDDLSNKMVFVGGARQIGKTTMARELVTARLSLARYYNWDYKPDRIDLIKGILPGSDGLVILDEIHKYKNWKNLLKGIYDTYKERYQLLVTGSARMDVYRHGGDSLLGRYHYYRLHPFSLAELEGIKNQVIPGGELNISTGNYGETLDQLLTFGGFPEIYIKANKRALRRWHNERFERLFREDIREVEDIRDVSNMLLLGDILETKVGSNLSINAIREDLEVSFRAVDRWLDILENFYYHFRIRPYYSQKVRSLRKDAKLYLTDWSEVQDEGARFENLIASHLIKMVHFLQDRDGYDVQLFYLRNVDKKEVDFLISYNGLPWFSVEAKLAEKSISPALYYFRERLHIPYNFQVIAETGVDKRINDIRLISADRFLAALI